LIVDPSFADAQALAAMTPSLPPLLPAVIAAADSGAKQPVIPIPAGAGTSIRKMVKCTRCIMIMHRDD
jgi:hypothetical protein